MSQTTSPYVAPNGPPAQSRGCLFALVGYVLGLATGCLVLPVLLIAGLTLLGQSIQSKFDTVSKAVDCADHPDAAGCPPH
jgi:hypothetical protein